MSYKSLKTILDRDLSVVASKPLSDEYSDLIDIVIDYSTNFIARVLDHGRNRADCLVTSYLLIHMFELADTISVLISKSIISPARILIRSVFEALIGTMFILQIDSKNRSLCFLYCKTLENLKTNKGIKKTPQNLDSYRGKWKKMRLLES